MRGLGRWPVRKLLVELMLISRGSCGSEPVGVVSGDDLRSMWPFPRVVQPLLHERIISLPQSRIPLIPPRTIHPAITHVIQTSTAICCMYIGRSMRIVLVKYRDMNFSQAPISKIEVAVAEDTSSITVMIDTVLIAATSWTSHIWHQIPYLTASDCSQIAKHTQQPNQGHATKTC